MKYNPVALENINERRKLAKTPDIIAFTCTGKLPYFFIKFPENTTKIEEHITLPNNKMSPWNDLI